jgi:hypothetical protein
MGGGALRREHRSGQATLVIDQTLYTTLDEAIVGLTAGNPTTKPDFEDKL